MTKFKSKAFFYHKPGDVRLGEIEIKCEPTDLVIKVMASARCGTDKTIFYKGHPKVDPNAPIILGHELVGAIVAVGSKVHALTEGIGYKQGETLSADYLDFKEGERVTVQSRIARHENGLMLLDNPIANLSFSINGAYSQYMKVTKEMIQTESVFRVEDTVSDEEGALVEPAACVLESIFATPHTVGVDKDGRHIFKSGIKQGGFACIFGSGSVSMIYAMLCKVEGSAEVYVIVRSDRKAEMVKKILGPDYKVVVVPPYDDKKISEKIEIENKIVESLKEMTQGRFFDDVIVACPSVDAQRLMFRLYNPSGYAVGACFGGTRATVDKADIDQNHYRCAKTIGTSGCSNKTIEIIINWLKEGKISLKGFTDSKKYTFKDDPKEFFTTTKAGLKPVLYPWM
jgi:L-iditol 2-dehydrogenase